MRSHYSIFFVLTLLTISFFIMIQSLQNGFEKFSDSFYGKKSLINLFTSIRLNLNDQVFPQVFVSDTDWLEYITDYGFDNYQNSISDDNLEATKQSLLILNKKLNARGITLIVVIAPDKSTIYPEKIPSQIQKLQEHSLLDKFITKLGPDGNLFLVDVRPTLLEAKDTYQVYYSGDTHWNRVGGFLVYQQIMHVLHNTYPNLNSYALSDFTIDETETFSTDLSRLLGADFTEFVGELSPKFASDTLYSMINLDYSMSWANNAQPETLLMYHDSFGRALIPLLANHFKQATYVQLKNPAMANINWIDYSHPDIVILEIVERHLTELNTRLTPVLLNLK